MPVDISDILHVLAHELRTPVGIAHGYIRLLLEDRLPQEADRRRAMEQIQKALARLSELSKESTSLAALKESDDAASENLSPHVLLERVAAGDYQSAVTVESAPPGDGLAVRTVDRTTLPDAIISLVRATAREVRGGACTVSSRVDGGRLEVLIGPPDQLAELASARARGDATPITLERGGLGLTLVHAAIVLEGHGAECWTRNGSRATAGLRLPLQERLEA
jgi:signal transduction histidine kinase